MQINDLAMQQYCSVVTVALAQFEMFKTAWRCWIIKTLAVALGEPLDPANSTYRRQTRQWIGSAYDFWYT